MHAGKPITFGPSAHRQISWDWHAAANFIGGGAGSGLIVFGCLAGAGSVPPHVMFGALALVALGLFFVWLEVGRPWRAFSVFLNLRRSWMSREAVVGSMLFASGLASVVVDPRFAWLAAAFALAFMYCQARMLQAARGIPAWREPLMVELVVATALAEGGGLYLLLNGPRAMLPVATIALFALIVLVRYAVWHMYRNRVAGTRDAAPALRSASAVVLVGTLVPLLLAAVAWSGAILPLATASLAGLVATLAGSYVKYALVTRAAFTRGIYGKPSGSVQQGLEMSLKPTSEAEQRKSSVRREPMTQY
jgi:phenylacetyl-CoA:acceptor oxidoreductase 26-kDa subunit